MSSFQKGDMVVRKDEYLNTHWYRVCMQVGLNPLGTFRVKRVSNRGTPYETTSLIGISEGYYSYKFKLCQETTLEELL